MKLEEYPIGTKAHSSGGGYWEKTKRGWKWCTGATFPRPGGDVCYFELPESPCVECDDSTCENCCFD